MFGKKKYSEINKILNDRFNQKGILIAQHRGAYGGNIVQNTLLAYKTSFLLGADMFEMDITKSTDSKLYCFHDGTEYLNLGYNKNLLTLSSKTIDNLVLDNSIGTTSGYHVQELDEVLEYFKNGELYNIDRSWNYINDVFKALKKHPHSIYQAILKGPVKKELLDKYENEEIKFMFMPIVRNVADIEMALSYNNINIVGFECIFDTENHPFFNDEFIKKIHDNGYFIWVNALTLSNLDKHIMCAGYDDNVSIEKGYEYGWKVLINKGYDIIQTDWPDLLSRHINKK